MNKMSAPRRKNKTRIALAALTALAAGSAWSQTAPSGGTALESVVVTGQSRTQELQSVPIVIQVVTPEQIQKLGANNVADMNGYIPGLDVDAHQPTQPKFTLRGIGSQDFLIGTDATVGIYVDGVYAGKTGGALLNFIDVKRVEVLKGPQGTLFGRNSAGGAISVVTNDPAPTFSASGLLRLGNYNTRHAEVTLNQPLNEDWSFRFSAVGQFSDGWIHDAVTGVGYGGDHAWGTRMALRWGGSDTTSMVLSWEHEDLDQRARPIVGLVGADPAHYIDPRNAQVTSDVPDNREARKFDGVTLRIRHTLPWAEFTSTTGYRHFTSVNKEDTDGTNNIATYLDTVNAESSSSWQQEFKLNGSNDKLDWVAGLSFFSENATQSSEVNTNTSSLDTFYTNLSGGQLFPFGQITGAAAQLGIPGINLLGLPWQETMFNTGNNKAIALYGDAIWHLSPATNVTFGARFTRDEKTFSWRYPQRVATALDTQLNALAGLGLFQDPQLGALYYGIPQLGFNGVSNNAPLVQGEITRPTPLEVKKTWNNVSPRLVLDQKLDANTMVYGSITKGYQAGGFTGLSSGGSYEPEYVTNLELGIKGQVPGTGLTYNAALFHFDFKNLQSLELVGIGADGFPKYVTQTSDRKADGLDLDLQWRPTRSLRLYSTMEYIDQRYDTYTSNTGVNLTGQPVGTPMWNIAAGIDSSWDAFGGTLNGLLQAAYVSEVRCNADTITRTDCLKTPTFSVGTSTTRVDARIGWESPKQAGGGRWGVALVVNNLLDKRYVSFVENTITRPLGVAYAETTAPRKVGLEFRASM
jgi:iron complex outermembrane receptor protein